MNYVPLNWRPNWGGRVMCERKKINSISPKEKLWVRKTWLPAPPPSAGSQQGNSTALFQRPSEEKAGHLLPARGFSWGSRPVDRADVLVSSYLNVTPSVQPAWHSQRKFPRKEGWEQEPERLVITLELGGTWSGFLFCKQAISWGVMTCQGTHRLWQSWNGAWVC